MYKICSRHNTTEILLMLTLNTNQLINQTPINQTHSLWNRCVLVYTPVHLCISSMCAGVYIHRFISASVDIVVRHMIICVLAKSFFAGVYLLARCFVLSKHQTVTLYAPSCFLCIRNIKHNQLTIYGRWKKINIPTSGEAVYYIFILTINTCLSIIMIYLCLISFI